MPALTFFVDVAFVAWNSGSDVTLERRADYVNRPFDAPGRGALPSCPERWGRTWLSSAGRNEPT